jgi:prephenate dehydrogenase
MKVAVIGGCGKMGQWLCRNLVAWGQDVIIADRDEKKLREAAGLFGVKAVISNTEAVNNANIIIVSVPIGNFEAVIKEIAPSIRQSQIVIDVTSVKARPVAIMHENIKKGLILGAHPLFGPDVNTLEGQNIILTPVNDKEKAFAAKATEFFKANGAGVTLMEPESHDRMMAVVQGLSHFVAIVAADALSGLGPLAAMQDVSTTTFRIFLNYIKTVIGDDPELYAAIQMGHRDMDEIYRALTQSVNKWAALVDKKDTPGFVKGMKALKNYIGD